MRSSWACAAMEKWAIWGVVLVRFEVVDDSNDHTYRVGERAHDEDGPAGHNERLDDFAFHIENVLRAQTAAAAAATTINATQQCNSIR